MSQQNSILKSSKREGSSSKKRISWGNNRVKNYINQEISPTQEEENIGSEDEAFVPDSLFPPMVSANDASIKSLDEMFEAAEINNTYLSPVSEEIESRSVISRMSNFTGHSWGVGVDMRSPTHFKEIHWQDSTYKASAKATPRPHTENDKIINDLKDQIVRAETERVIADSQYNHMKAKIQQLSEHYKAQKTMVSQHTEENRALQEIRNYQFKKLIDETNSLHEKKIIDIPLEERYNAHTIHENNTDVKIYCHKTTIIDCHAYDNLIIAFTSHSLKLHLKRSFETIIINSIWEKYKLFIENSCSGSEDEIMAYISKSWYCFLHFISSFEKLLLISDINIVEINDICVTVSVGISNYNWNILINFHDFRNHWDIFAMVKSKLNN